MNQLARQSYRFIFTLLICTWLSACAIQQSPLKDIERQANFAERQRLWQAHRVLAESLERWQVKGKIAVKAGNKGGHASLRWNRVNPDNQHIELFGPLGGGRVEIDTDKNGARLKDTKGGYLQGDSVAALIVRRLGWPLPFDQLPFWLRGLPASDAAQMEWDEQGRIVRVNDMGWQVSYPDYQTIATASGDKVDVPRSIELNALPGTLRVYDKNGEFIGENFFVRVIIQSWLP